MSVDARPTRALASMAKVLAGEARRGAASQASASPAAPARRKRAGRKP